MEFIANRLNNTHLRDILPDESDEIDGVLAAVAYGSSSANEKEDFISNCIDNHHRLDIWMRYDHTVPVSVPLLQRLLRSHSKNIFCKLIPDYLHSKVIWWKGYGAYIGSANLTDRAWLTNIEAGIFLTENDLQSSEIIFELENFFDQLKNLDVAFPLSDEIISEMEELEKLRRSTHDLGKDKRTIPEWNGPNFHQKQTAKDKQKESFHKEWYETLTVLRNIGDQVGKNRPAWIDSSIPIGWQTDQFLHAYYYNQVGEGNKKPYEDYYQSHKANPQASLHDAIKWWQNLSTPPSNEDHTLYETAPYIKEHLKKDHILNLTTDEIINMCGYTHATIDHIIKISLTLLGRPDLKTLSREERIPLFGDWLMKQKNKKGWDIRQLLHFVLYEGSDDTLWERLYMAGRTDEYSISHYGLNSLAEIVGWARPDIAPPRNGRTSKALRALGYDVRIY